jgi:hypothetical protein
MKIEDAETRRSGVEIRQHDQILKRLNTVMFLKKAGHCQQPVICGDDIVKSMNGGMGIIEARRENSHYFHAHLAGGFQPTLTIPIGTCEIHATSAGASADSDRTDKPVRAC